MDYIAAGNVSLDQIVYDDGGVSEVRIGGPSVFALSGIGLYTDSCMLLSNVGEDFDKYYGDWVDSNKFCRDGIIVKSEFTTLHKLRYLADGTYTAYKWDRDWEMIENRGYLRVSPEQIEEYGHGVRGVFLSQNADRVFWDKLIKVRDACGFKIMWEFEMMHAIPENLDAVREIAPKVDAFSMNYKETQRMFGIKSLEEAIEALRSLGCPYVFFRAGEIGAYSITQDGEWFVPGVLSDNAVDATGCGNSSTAAALYGLCEGYDPLKIAIVSNIAAHHNVQYKGLIEDVHAIREEALQQVDKIYAELSS